MAGVFSFAVFRFCTLPYLQKGTPLVVLKGSGRAADCMALLVKELTAMNEKKEIKDKDELLTQIGSALTTNKSSPVFSEFIKEDTEEEFMILVTEILQHWRNIHIYQVTDVSNLGSLILDAVINKHGNKPDLTPDIRHKNKTMMDALKITSDKSDNFITTSLENYKHFEGDELKRPDQFFDRIFKYAETMINPGLQVSISIKRSSTLRNLELDHESRDGLICSGKSRHRKNLIDDFCKEIWKKKDKATIMNHWKTFTQKKTKLDKNLYEAELACKKLILAVQFNQLDTFEKLLRDYQDSYEMIDFLFMCVLEVILSFLVLIDTSLRRNI